MRKTAYFPINSAEDNTDALSKAYYQASLWRRRCFMALAFSPLFILLLLGVFVKGMHSQRNCSSSMADVVIPYCRYT